MALDFLRRVVQEGGSLKDIADDFGTVLSDQLEDTLDPESIDAKQQERVKDYLGLGGYRRLLEWSRSHYYKERGVVEASIPPLAPTEFNRDAFVKASAGERVS